MAPKEHGMKSSVVSFTAERFDDTSDIHVAQQSSYTSTMQPANYCPDGLPSLCSHCGGLTPRSGATTVYGTPLIRSPAASGWNSESSSIFSVCSMLTMIQKSNTY